jgi:hypothetical protein
MHDRSQSLAPADPRRAEEMVNVISAHFRNRRLPPEIARADPEATCNAHIIAARHHLRSGRFLAALKHMQQAFALHPQSYLRLRNWRLLANGLLNRIGYKLLSQFNRIFSRE